VHQANLASQAYVHPSLLCMCVCVSQRTIRTVMLTLVTEPAHACVTYNHTHAPRSAFCRFSCCLHCLPACLFSASMTDHMACWQMTFSCCRHAIYRNTMHCPYSVPDHKVSLLAQQEWPSMPLLGRVTAQGTHTGTDSHGSHLMIQGKLLT